MTPTAITYHHDVYYVKPWTMLMPRVAAVGP